MGGDKTPYRITPRMYRNSGRLRRRAALSTPLSAGQSYLIDDIHYGMNTPRRSAHMVTAKRQASMNEKITKWKKWIDPICHDCGNLMLSRAMFLDIRMLTTSTNT